MKNKIALGTAITLVAGASVVTYLGVKKVLQKRKTDKEQKSNNI